MPNLVYYKDSNGVVCGPFKEEEATALFKANFFRPDHTFRVVDANPVDEFASIGDLQSLNGAETPFGQTGDEKEQKELIRVYKELERSLKDRVGLENHVKSLENDLKKYANQEVELEKLRDSERRREILEKWEVIKDENRRPGYFKIRHLQDAGCYVALFENKSPIDVKVMVSLVDIGTVRKTTVVESGCKERLRGTGSRGLYIIPAVCDDLRDGFLEYNDCFTKYWDRFTF